MEAARSLVVSARQKNFQGRGVIGQNLSASARYNAQLRKAKSGMSIQDYYTQNVKDQFGGAYGLEAFQSLAQGYGSTLEGDELSQLADTLASQQFLSSMSLNTGSGTSAESSPEAVTNLTESTKGLLTTSQELHASVRQLNESVSITNESVRGTAKVVGTLQNQ
jgi:hypothetical protein